MSRLAKPTKSRAKSALALSLALAICGCSSLNETFDDLTFPSLPSLPSVPKLFQKKKAQLPGDRIAVIQDQDTSTFNAATTKVPLSLPTAFVNPSWAQPGGVASNAPGHLQFSGNLQTIWSANAGKGSNSRGHLTASPIVYDGKIFTLDTRGQISAFSVASGGRVWKTNLTPENEKKNEGFGGGLSASGGRLFVATGYGTVIAINPSNGSQLWSKNLSVPIRSSPTSSEDWVFVLNSEGRFYCLSAIDGKELWSFRGLPENARLLGNASPAISGDKVVASYPIGEVIAFHMNSGKPYWSETLSRRRTISSLATLLDPARPVIDQNIVYAVGHGGRMVATSLKDGERIWTRNIQGVQAPAVAGDSVFVVDVNGKLMALTRQGGKTRWLLNLPGKGKWSGPLLAGHKLWLASSTGLLVGVDAVTGKLISQKDVGHKIFISPIIANGRMYILTDKARLIAIS